MVDMQTKADKIYNPRIPAAQKQPFFDVFVPAGFPSPAADYREDKLDLNEHLIKNPPATFFVRVAGDSMKDAGIHPDDLLVVDRSIKPRDKSVVIAAVDGEYTVKRLKISKGKIYLQAENESYSDLNITEDCEFEVWGVVTSVIHKL